MPAGLHGSYAAHHLHLVTFSCYRRLPLLNSERARDRLLSILEQARQRYRFVVVGYVFMPGQVHLLITGPDRGTPSTAMQVLKQPTARALLPAGSAAIRNNGNCLGNPGDRETWDRRDVSPVFRRKLYSFTTGTEGQLFPPPVFPVVNNQIIPLPSPSRPLSIA